MNCWRNNLLILLIFGWFLPENSVRVVTILEHCLNSGNCIHSRDESLCTAATREITSLAGCEFKKNDSKLTARCCWLYHNARDTPRRFRDYRVWNAHVKGERRGSFPHSKGEERPKRGYSVGLMYCYHSNIPAECTTIVLTFVGFMPVKLVYLPHWFVGPMRNLLWNMLLSWIRKYHFVCIDSDLCSRTNLWSYCRGSFKMETWKTETRFATCNCRTITTMEHFRIFLLCFVVNWSMFWTASRQ